MVRFISKAAVRAVSLASLLLIAPMALAGSDKIAVMEGEFAAQKQAILTALNDGETYRDIDRKDREQVLVSLDRIEKFLAGVDDVRNIPVDDQLVLMNEQELVNTLLTKGRKDSMQVCTRRGTAGTHFKKVQCETVAERRARQEDDQQRLQSLLRSRADDPLGGM